MANQRNSTGDVVSINDKVMRAQNAFVEEVFSDNRGTGYILISYGVIGQNNLSYIKQLRLNVSRGTALKNRTGKMINLRDFIKGMRVNAEFSSAFTKSIPPQTSALEIVALEDESSVSVTTDRVATVDVNNGFLFVGNLCDLSDQMKFIVSNSTVIISRNGNRIRLANLRPCQMVRVEHASFQTMSIPPQTTAFRIQVL